MLTLQQMTLRESKEQEAAECQTWDHRGDKDKMFDEDDDYVFFGDEGD